MSSEEPLIIHNGDKSRLAAATALYGEVFKTDPVWCYVLGFRNPNSHFSIQSRIPKTIGYILTATSKCNARFDEIWTRPQPSDSRSPPQCSAVILPPGESIGMTSLLGPSLMWNLGFGGMKCLVTELAESTEEAKSKALVRKDGSEVEKYWYLFFLGTDESERGKGLGASMLRDLQLEVKLLIWLESSSEGSRRLYLRMGFTEASSWVVGKGVVGKDGWREDGGEGVKLWGTIWKPDGWDEWILEKSPIVS